MAIQDRKKRQLAEREEVFLDQAWAMIQREGVLNLQMSRLAAETDYAVGTLYLHFSSKEDLLVALATRRMGERIELFQRAANWQVTSRSRMVAILLADVLFALRSPEFFRLTQYVSTQPVWAAASAERRADALDASRPLGVAVQTVVDAAIRCGDVNSHGLSSRDLCSGLWSMCVGMHALVGAAGVLESQCVSRPYQLLQLHAHALLNGLGWQPLMRVDDVAAQQQLVMHIMRELFPECLVAAEAVVLNPLARCNGDGLHE